MMAHGSGKSVSWDSGQCLIGDSVCGRGQLQRTVATVVASNSAFSSASWLIRGHQLLGIEPALEPMSQVPEQIYIGCLCYTCIVGIRIALMGKQQKQTRELSSCCLESARTPDLVNISHKLKQNCGFYNCYKDTVESSMDLAGKAI